MPHHTQPTSPLADPKLGAWRLAFARLHDVLAALDEAGVDPDDKLEEGDAVRALAAERDHLRDLVDAVREELGLLEVHDDAEVLRELAALKALRANLAAERGGYIGGDLS
jgi:hypothetical protein